MALLLEFDELPLVLKRVEPVADPRDIRLSVLPGLLAIVDRSTEVNGLLLAFHLLSHLNIKLDLLILALTLTHKFLILHGRTRVRDLLLVIHYAYLAAEHELLLRHLLLLLFRLHGSFRLLFAPCSTCYRLRLTKHVFDVAGRV